MESATLVTIIDKMAITIVDPYFGIMLASVILLAPFWLRKSKSSGQIQVIVTTAGMFGTFLGIVAGISLLDLGIENINGSIKELLGGLTTAFLTSIAGLAASLVIQIKPFGFNYGIDKEVVVTEEPQEKLLTEILDEMKSLNKNISGEGDASLTTQIQKMRVSIVDKQDELNKAFKAFAEQMVDSNIDALAKAIDKVMGDFNTTVNEKLGEAFDNFRKSVEHLNQWQSEYKNQILEQTNNLNKQNENLEGVRETFTVMSEELERMSKGYEKISEINVTFDELVEKLNGQLGGSIEFAKSINNLVEDLEGSGEKIKKEIKDIAYSSVNEMEETMQKTLTSFGEKLASISGRMAEDFERIQSMLQSINNKE